MYFLIVIYGRVYTFINTNDTEQKTFTNKYIKYANPQKLREEISLDNSIPTLFISYSHDSDEHKEWVFKLAHDLRVIGGINVLLDQWSVRLGGSLKRFMEEDLTDSMLVLCICSDGYEKRSEDPSSGVAEEMKVLDEKLNSKDSEFIIPLIKNNHPKRVPKTLSSGKLRYINSDESTYEELFDDLVERIWSEDLKKMPPIGTNPFSNSSSAELDRKLINHEVMYHNPNLASSVDFNFKDNNGEFVIGRGDYTFTTKWTKRGSDSIYAYNDPGDIKMISHKANYFLMPNSIKEILEEYEISSFSSRTREPKINELVIWKNIYDKFAVTKIEDIKVNENKGEFKLKFSYKIIEK